MTNRTVAVEITGRVQGLMAAFATGKKGATDFGNEVGKMAKDHADKFNRMALVTAGAGAAMLGVFGAVVKSAMEFDKQMSEVASVSNANAKEFGALREAAIRAGKETAYSATEAAKAESELAKAGVSTADILGGALAGSLSLAAAGQMDLADAATISAQAMNIFHLKGSSVGHIADVLAAGANKSAADMHGLGDSLRQGGMVASQMGMSLDQTVGVLSAFADNALIGSDAGTSLKTMLIALAKPSDAAAKTMKQLGVNAWDAQGNFVGIVNLAGQLHDKLGPLTQAQRSEALATIFGTDAIRSANVLLSLGSDRLQEYVDGVNDAGAASRTAGQKMDNLAGDVEQLKGSLETMAIEAGSGANKGLRILTQAATGAVNAFLDLPSAAQSGAVVVTGITGGLLLATTGFLKAKQTADDFMSTLRGMGPQGEKVAGVLGSVGKYAGIAGAAVGGTVLLVEGIKALTEWMARDMKPVTRNLDALTSSLLKFAESGKLTGELQKVAGKGFDQWAKDLANLTFWHDLDEATHHYLLTQQQLSELDKRYPQIIADQQALDKAMAGLASNGNANQAAQAFGKIRAALEAHGYTLAQINAMFPQYTAAAAQAGAANTGLARGFGDASTNLSTLTNGLEEAVAKGQALTDVWNQLNGALLSSDKAALDASQAIDAVKTSLQENKNATEGNTQAALKSRIAIGDAAQAAVKAAQAKLDETQSLEQANATYNQYIAQLRATMLAMGLSKSRVDELLAAYAAMPPMVSNKFSAPGLEAAYITALRYKNLLGNISNFDVIDTTFKVYFQSTAKPSSYFHGNRWGGVYQHAEVGALRDATVYSSVSSGARYAFAEPATGGEAFVPKFGDYGRSTAILDQAARWYGGRFMPGGRGGGASAVQVSISVAPGGTPADRLQAQMIGNALHTGALQLRVNGTRVEVGSAR